MFKLLLAAPQSFNRYESLHDRLNYYLRGKVNAELHIITLKHWTQEVKAYATKYGHTVKVHARDFAMDGPKTVQVIYSKIIEHVDGAVIFWDQESINEKLLIKMCQERPLKHYVETFESLKQELDRLKREGKIEKKQKKAIIIEDHLKARYYDIHKQWQERTTPEAVKDHGYTKCKPVVIYNAGGLQTWLENIFNWSGHHMQRISSQGTYRKGVGYTYSGTTNGATDDNGHFVSANHAYPLPVYVETKFGKDVMSKPQLKFMGKMQRTGALHFIQSVPGDAFLILDYLGTL